MWYKNAMQGCEKHNGTRQRKSPHDWKWNFLGSLYEPSHRRGPQGRPQKSFSNQLQYKNGLTPTSISQRMTTCMYYTTLDRASWRWLTVDCSLVKRWCVWWFAGFTFVMPSNTVNAWWLIILFMLWLIFYFSQFLFFLHFKFISILYMYTTIPKN